MLEPYVTDPPWRPVIAYLVFIPTKDYKRDDLEDRAFKEGLESLCGSIRDTFGMTEIPLRAKARTKQFGSEDTIVLIIILSCDDEERAEPFFEMKAKWILEDFAQASVWVSRHDFKLYEISNPIREGVSNLISVAIEKGQPRIGSKIRDLFDGIEAFNQAPSSFGADIVSTMLLELGNWIELNFSDIDKRLTENYWGILNEMRDYVEGSPYP